MRIAYISTLKSVAWGGSEELWFQSAKEAIAQGHTIGIFVYDWPNEPPSLKELRQKGAMIFKRPRQESLKSRLVHKLMMKLGKAYPLFLNPYKDLTTFKPDVIAVTDGATYYAANDNWLYKMLLQYEKKYVIISQGNNAYHLPNSRIDAVTLFNKAKQVVFVADNNRQQAFHQLACFLTNTCVIQNPVNTTSFDQLPLPGGNDKLIHCAMVGRLCISDKGQDIVIAMMSEEYWQKSNVVIHIYGKGDDLEYLHNLIKYYNVSNKVFIEGYTVVEDIWKKCHSLLMPSIAEGTPLTLLEALVAGRICVVTDVGGNNEWIKDGENGFLVDAPVKELFSGKLKYAVSQFYNWPELANEAHRSAMQKLDKNPGLTLLNKMLE